MSPIEPTEAGCQVRIRAQPRASRTELAGLHGGSLKVRVAAPPVDGAANEALTRFLAEILGVGRRAVHLVRGDAARDKIFAIEGLTAEEARIRLGI